MIKINNISKFFFKGKPNEIKALQNVSLDLEEGLVMLVGKSGCGKTTLLNVVGGLEKPDCGSITVGGTTISRYQCEQWDKLRNRTIGYVFQNYNLIDELTVYQNLELVLKLAGIDENTYPQRIEYALSLVGMSKYAKRHPSSLSGGQQQRVGIARAVVKGAKVIIADEPTGNLDDTNTIAVMELLKGLSKHCLVVVVTHEEDLAAFYADRIIRLQDGKIVDDSINEGEGSIEHRAADHVYLGDMQRTDFDVDATKIAVYQEGDMPAAKVSIVCQNGRILLKVDGDQKVTYVTKDSSIVLDEGKFVARTKDDKDVPIDTDLLVGGTGKPKRIFTLMDCFKSSVARIMSKWGMRRKNPYRLLYNTAIFFVVMIALAGPAFLYDRDNQVVVDDNVYAVMGTVQAAELPQGTVVINKAATSAAYIELGFSRFGNDLDLNANYLSLMPYSAVGGTANKGEVYVDKLLYKRMNERNLTDGYVLSERELVGKPFTMMVSEYGYFVPTGETVSVEMPDLAPAQGVGTDPVDSEEGYYDGYGDYIYPNLYAEYSYKVAGWVDRNSPVVYLSDEDYAALPTVHFYTRSGNQRKEITLLYNADAGAIKRFAKEKNVKLINLASLTRSNFYREAIVSKLVFVILAGVVLFIMVFSMARLARNEYVGKIKLYAQYRSIGVSRGAIYGKISAESAIISLFTSLRGWFLTSLILVIANNMQFMRSLRNMGLDFFYYPVWFALICGVFMVVLNQVVNLLSPVGLLAHTPSKLMTKYDI